MATTTAMKYTVEEYLTLDNQDPYKSEYIKGVIYPLSDVSPRHSLIGTSLVAQIYFQIKRRGEVHFSKLRTKIANIDAYFYPDVAIVLGNGEFDRRGGHHLLNPTVIIEILSPSTADFDREKKFKLYQRIPWLEEYVLISQDKMYIEHYKRWENGMWQTQPTIYQQSDDLLVLESVGCTLKVRDIYDDVRFDPE